MRTSMKVAVACYALGGAIGLFMAVKYWTADQFMPYHAVVLGGPWESLSPGAQRIVLGLLQSASAGFLTLAVAALVLIVPIARGDAWARRASLAISCAGLIPLVYLTLTMRLSTGAPFPVVPASVALALALAAFAAAEMDGRRRFLEGGLPTRNADLPRG